jgi:hypothetical protein
MEESYQTNCRVHTSFSAQARKPVRSHDLTEKLESSLIETYEKACKSGLHPTDALATILIWAAEETKRFRPDVPEQASHRL